MFRARRSALAALSVALLAVAACGDDSSDVDAASQDTSTTEATAADTSGGESSSTTTAAAAEVAELPDACSLVEPSEIEALIGGAEPAGENDTAIDGLDYSQCVWENDAGLFIVAVIDGPERFEAHQENLPGDPVDGIGDDAITAAGVSSETKGATGGRTISALVDGRTLVVALKVEGQTTVEMVAPIATTVAERLSA